MDASGIGAKILLFAPPLIIAVVLHEIAHGYVAYKLGDPTAKSLKRLSLNPLRHVDPYMTVALPGLLILAGSPIVFGGAKPVPVDPRYFKNPRRGMMLVAVAGPVTNFILAFLSYLLLDALYMSAPPSSAIGALAAGWCITSIIVNLVLGTFNLVPVPPLDGGRIAVGLLPRKAAMMLAKLEPYGILIVFLLLLSGLLDRFIRPIVEGVLSLISGSGAI